MNWSVRTETATAESVADTKLSASVTLTLKFALDVTFVGVPITVNVFPDCDNETPGGKLLDEKSSEPPDADVAVYEILEG